MSPRVTEAGARGPRSDLGRDRVSFALLRPVWAVEFRSTRQVADETPVAAGTGFRMVSRAPEETR